MFQLGLASFDAGPFSKHAGKSKAAKAVRTFEHKDNYVMRIIKNPLTAMRVQL
jgi:hypothetical protein